MATTFVEYTGDGNATKQFTFPSYQESDVKVRVDGVLKTTSTHYNITSYTTTGGGNVVFTSGNIPSSPANIRIYRDTNVDTAKATFTAGSSVKAADLNNNTTQLLYRAQEEQIPNLIHSYDIDDDAIIRSKILADAVDGTKIADDSINSEHYVDGSIDTQHIADSQITSAKIADGTIVNADVNASAAIAGTKISPDFGSQNIVTTGTISTGSFSTSGTVDGRDVAADGTKLDTIETGATADQTAAEIRTLVESASDSNVFTDADHSKLNAIEAGATADQTNAEIRAAVEAASDSNVFTDADHGKLNGIEAGATADQTNAEIRAAVEAATDSNVFTDADHTKLNAIEAGATADQTITEIKSLIAGSPLDSSHLAANSVTTSEIADGELTTLAGMQSATASKLADSTALTADIADLNQIDGMAKQTTITDDDTKFPTSGAVVDYVAAQLEPFGGFEAIANESSFPNTQPVSGVAISIADAGGMAVSGSGTASGATVGGTTVNISGIASNFHGSTVAAGIRFIVTSTGSGQNYTYHKATLKEDDLINLSGDINDFSERYRVGASNPTTSLDSGDLFFNTGSGKLLVYNGSNAAWEETQSVGNFFINTISSSSATGGGSATPNGTAYRFTLSNAGANAQQHLVSVDGVIQKPNSGTSQPSEGFAIDGGDIIFGSAPVNGASVFVVTIGASVSIGTPSNNTVTTAILQNGSVTTPKITDVSVTTAKIADDAVTAAKLASSAVVTASIVDANVTTAKINANAVTAAKIADDAVTTAKIADSNVTTAKIADDAVTAAKLASSAVVTASIVDANVTTAKIADDAVTADKLANSINTEIAANTAKTTNATHTGDVTGATSLTIASGAVTTAKIADDAVTADKLANTSVSAGSYGSSSAIPVITVDAQGRLTAASTAATSSDLVADTSPQLGGDLASNGNDIKFANNDKAIFGTGNDAAIYHNDTDFHIDAQASGATRGIYITAGTVSSPFITLRTDDGEKMLECLPNDGVYLFHNNNLKLRTTSAGTELRGDVHFDNHTNTGKDLYWDESANRLSFSDSVHATFGNGEDLRVYHDGSSNYIMGTGSHALIFGANNYNRFRLTSDGHLRPESNNARDLGTSSYRWRNVYTNDLNLSNEGSSNDMDGTWGDWTIQEGESDLFLKNNRSGKKYKFNLTEVS